MLFINSTYKNYILYNKEMFENLQHPYRIVRPTAIQFINDKYQGLFITTFLIDIPSEFFQILFQRYHGLLFSIK